MQNIGVDDKTVRSEVAVPGVVAKPKIKYNYKEIVTSGIFKENPVFTLMLSMCSALGVTSNVVNSVGLGTIVLITLILTNSAISLIGKFVPDAIRIPVYITVIAAVVTIMEMLVEAFVPALFSALGIFISLVVVNCIILGRAEAYAGKNPLLPSILDAIGNGLGIIVALGTMGFTRELIGTGALDLGFYEFRLFPEQYGVRLFAQPFGAFIMLGVIIGVITTVRMVKSDAQKAKTAAAAKSAALARA